MIVIQGGVDEGNAGVENGRRSREQKKKKKRNREQLTSPKNNKQLTSPKNKRERGGEGDTSPKNKREKGGEGGGDGEKRSREQRLLGSNSVSERTKDGSSAAKERTGKSEQKNRKSPQFLGGHSVASMMRRRERGGCPATGEGLFPDITTGCQVLKLSS